ncbi:hypothetical protein [Amycolatopsis sp. NPDC051128]|uniref:hypothetical protein n=1 Tax=Amycolatopsis sp. NPDC051128 TaxID=3155412 RepID=UPI0034208116
MSKYVALQILGMVVLALGGQGVVRLLIDHDRAGLLSWLPGGFAAWLTGHCVIALVGVLLTGWADTRRKRRETS